MKTTIPLSLKHLIVEREPLWPLTSIRVGGTSRWLAKPRTIADLEAILSWIQHHALSYITLGSGTNVIFSDEGYAGVVIHTQHLIGAHIEGEQVIASAGEPLARLAMKLNRRGLSGLEWACGIPGTVGGALVMNAGAYDRDMASVVQWARILTPLSIEQWSLEQLRLGYRQSGLPEGSIVLEVSLKLQQAERGPCIEREREILEKRRGTQPQGATCGCIFKNPLSGQPAGMLLDQAECKGMRIGSAVVSDKHANFIVNEGQDNATHVLALIDRMRTQVLEHHGISLEPEVQVIDTTE